MFDTTKFEYIQAFVENNFNVTKAAQKLHITQPALSKVLNTLEDNEKLPLFIRQHKHKIIGFTDLGKFYYENMLQLYQSYQGIKEQIAYRSQSYICDFVIGVQSYLLETLLLKAFPELLATFPQIRFQIVEDTPDNLRKKLEENQCNLILLLHQDHDTYDYNENIIYQKIAVSNYSAFMSKEHLLAKEKEITLRDAIHYELLIPAPHTASYQIITTELKKQKLKYNIFTTATSWRILLNIALQTSLIAILPSNAINLLESQHTPAFAVIPLKENLIWEAAILKKATPNKKQDIQLCLQQEIYGSLIQAILKYNQISFT